MRVDLRFLGFALAVSTAGAVFSACSGEVTTNTGGAGTSSQTTSSTTTDTTTTSSTTTTTSSSTSTTTTTTSSTTSTLSGNSCMMTCGLVVQCFGFDVCGMFGIDCNNPIPQAQCAIDCIDMANPDCSNIQGVATACFTSCMGMMGDGGMGGSCQQCAGMSCMGEVGACFGDGECQDWLQCIGGCQDSTCTANCDTQYANAKPLYDAVYACTCANCSSQCAVGDPCSHVPDGG